MPSSMHFNLSFMTGFIFKCKPKTVLDVGVGYGKWGLLCREFIEAHADRCFPKDWKSRVDGVEIWERYIEGFPWLRKIYDQIYHGDISKILGSIGKYDMIIAGDIIEHMPKRAAERVLRGLIQRTNKVFLLSIPLGENWLDNKIVDNNPHEKHQSSWAEAEVMEYFGPTVFKAYQERRATEKVTGGAPAVAFAGPGDARVEIQIDQFGRGPIGAFAFMKVGAKL